MAVFKINKTRDYTVLSNHHLRDNRLSLKAKGLLTLMLSLPEDWDYSIAGLVAICKEGESAVKSALSELKDCNYLVITKLNPDESGTGQYGYRYDIYEIPQEGGFLALENQHLENQAVENHGQLNTKKQSKDRQNTDSRFKKPDIEEIKEYAKDKGYSHFNAQCFFDYYESNGWKVGRNPMKDWRAAIRTWIMRDNLKTKEPTAPPKANKRCSFCGGRIFWNVQMGKFECVDCFMSFDREYRLIS